MNLSVHPASAREALDAYLLERGLNRRVLAEQLAAPDGLPPDLSEDAILKLPDEALVRLRYRLGRGKVPTSAELKSLSVVAEAMRLLAQFRAGEMAGQVLADRITELYERHKSPDLLTHLFERLQFFSADPEALAEEPLLLDQDELAKVVASQQAALRKIWTEVVDGPGAQV